MIVDGITRKRLQELAIKTLLDADTFARDRVFEARDWPTRPELFPMLLVQTPRDRKISLGRGIIQFNTTITLVVVGRMVGAHPDEVNQGLDLLAGQVEDALLCTPEFVQNIQQFTVVSTETVVTSAGKQHVGEIGMSFECEIYQSFGPNHGVPLKGVRGEITGANGTLATVNVKLPITS